MLFNPKWSAPTLAEFGEWLEAQPADKTYEWMGGECAMAQFLEATRPGQPHPAMPKWYVSVTQPKPHTFGAALARAKAFAG